MLVVIAGTPRSGKDTLVAHMQKLLARSQVGTVSLSSIDAIKQFVYPYMKKFDLYQDEPTRDMRQTLADVKQVLDRQPMQFTVRLAMDYLANMADGVVLFYHVRELANVQELCNKCYERGIEYLSVCLYRDLSETLAIPAATTEDYTKIRYDTFDMVLRNEVLDDLNIYAAMLSRYIESRLARKPQ